MVIFYERINYCPKCGCYKEADKEYCNSHMQAIYEVFSKANESKGQS